MERTKVSLSITVEMHKHSQERAQEDDRTLADWIRHCICYGLENPEEISKVRCKNEYQMLPRGRP